jgi:hypothetical protein
MPVLSVPLFLIITLLRHLFGYKCVERKRKILKIVRITKKLLEGKWLLLTGKHGGIVWVNSVKRVAAVATKRAKRIRVIEEAVKLEI